MISILNNEKGSVLLIGIAILALLIIIGVAATNTTTLELRIAGNDRAHKTAFYAAEAARAYVRQRTELYHGDNIEPEEYLIFPDTGNYTLIKDPPYPPYPSFNGDVIYDGVTPPPRGSGFDAGKYRAHNYQMTCNGLGPNSARSRVAAGFYRIGF